MKQMDVDKTARIDLDYNDADLPEPVRQFKPVLYKDGDSFSILLGPDPQEGVYGRGLSVDEAIKNWEQHFNDEIDNPREGNETTRFILDNLNTF
jgi:hypothetical protein